MKKIFFGIVALVAMVATSCQQSLDELNVVGGGDATVTFNVGAGSRAYSDGKTATNLQWAVYAVTDNGTSKTLSHLSALNGSKTFDLSTTVEFQLTTGNKYAVIFWAAANNSPYTVTFGTNGAEMTVDYNSAKSNDENRDAFYKYHEFTVSGSQTESVELKRPFAQLNIGTSDLTASANAGYTVSHVKVEVPAYNTLNLVSGEASGNVTVAQKFDYAALPNGEEFPVTGYEYMAMNYVLMKASQETFDVTFTYATDENGANEKSRTVGSVPFQRNHRTNLYGQLLTSDVAVNVEIKPEYEDDQLEAWDGVTLNEPTFDDATKTYYISHAAELAYIAQLVNGTLDTDNVSRTAVAANSLNGYTVKLECDINLNGKEWTPIGVGSNHFRGTFDGNNQTIYGLKVTERGDTRAALFGTVSYTVEFRNLTIDGASIECPDYADDFYGAALIGTIYGNVTINNVDVVNSYISGNNKVGALIAHDGSSTKVNISGCDVSKTTFEALGTEDGGLCGGLIGYFQSGNEHHIANCSVKDCTFNVVNSENTGKRANGHLIGGTNSKASQVLNIDDCVVENNTWNEKFYAGGVEVTTNTHALGWVKDGIVWIGGERDDNAEGKVIIDGEEVYAMLPIVENDAVVPGIGILGATKTTDENGNEVVKYTYGVTGAEGMDWVAKQVDGSGATRDGMAYTFEGETVKLLQDIDLLKIGDNGEPVCFDPIGSYRHDKAFKGTFDGQDHIIKNMNQNTWALDNGYYYNDCGMGLFGLVMDATIKNLKIDNANLSGESAICGVVAGCAYGDMTFENITITNSKCADYQYYSGGIVGWASGNHTYKNCNIDASTTIAAQWGDFDNSTGGVIGGAGGSAKILLEDCTVACRIDAYNDVTSSYQWYAYRRCGMLIGNPGATKKVGDTTYADAPQLTCKNVKVIYGDWMNYTYCEFAGTSWPYVRVQAGLSNSAYSNPRYGHPTDANGNTVVDDNHVHNEGEDHHIVCAFNQLYGGGQGVYGTPTHDGVTITYPASFNPNN